MRKVEVYLEYQPLIHEPPVSPGALYQAAAANDQTTLDHWKHTWLGNITANKQTYGNFGALSVGQEFAKYEYGAAIVAGSGPSLKVNAEHLKNRGKIPLISCLHNFHYFEDLGLAPEYYVTLDANLTMCEEEVTEGGKRSVDEYWALTKDRTLIAYIGTAPALLKRWQGKILFYNCSVPSDVVEKQIDDIEYFPMGFSTGGNVLGASLYFAKAVLGATQTIFVGADFSFGYDRKFHSWDSKYDAVMGHTLRVTDIFGNKIHTWPSYYGFKQYFDQVSITVPGIYYNCTEGGVMGAFDQGNLASFRYIDLKDCLQMFNNHHLLKNQMLGSPDAKKMILYR